MARDRFKVRVRVRVTCSLSQSTFFHNLNNTNYFLHSANYPDHDFCRHGVWFSNKFEYIFVGKLFSRQKSKIENWQSVCVGGFLHKFNV